VNIATFEESLSGRFYAFGNFKLWVTKLINDSGTECFKGNLIPVGGDIVAFDMSLP
jgi:hypothetical protein